MAVKTTGPISFADLRRTLGYKTNPNGPFKLSDYYAGNGVVDGSRAENAAIPSVIKTTSIQTSTGWSTEVSPPPNYEDRWTIKNTTTSWQTIRATSEYLPLALGDFYGAAYYGLTQTFQSTSRNTLKPTSVVTNNLTNKSTNTSRQTSKTTSWVTGPQEQTIVTTVWNTSWVTTTTYTRSKNTSHGTSKNTTTTWATNHSTTTTYASSKSTTTSFNTSWNTSRATTTSYNTSWNTTKWTDWYTTVSVSQLIP